MRRDILGKSIEKLKDTKLFLLDMDGTIYLDEQLFDFVPKFLSRIEENGGRYVFVTNNASKSVDDYVKKMHRIGLPNITAEHFYTSVQASCAHLRKRHEGQLVYVQGTKSMVEEFILQGIKVTTEYCEGIGAIIVGYDPEITGDKLYTTCKVLTKYPNVPYYATNPDWVCPVDFGYVPDCGSMCQGIFRATGREPIYIGKPKPTMIEFVMQNYDVKKSQTVVIGDRLYTDVAAGNNAGVDTICVLSGEVSYEEVIVAAESQKPTYLLNSVEDIFE